MDIDILLQKLAKPAQRAIENEGIKTMEQNYLKMVKRESCFNNKVPQIVWGTLLLV